MFKQIVLTAFRSNGN